MECLAKQKLNIILLIDSSKSMGGTRIKQVDQAIKDIKNFLLDFQDETLNLDFYLSIIPFGTDAYFYEGKRCINVKDLDYKGIKTGGWSNLHAGYDLLTSILHKESKGGIMPDFGGVAPIILLLTDGHPTGNKYKESLQVVEKSAWFKVALRYGIAIEKDDSTTSKVLHDFVGSNGDVLQCVDANKLKDLIKIIVVTASKVKSRSTNVSHDLSVNANTILQQEISEALTDIENLEW